MVTVSTKAQLKAAIEQKQFPIKCVGEIAEQMRKKKKRATKTKIAGAAIALAGVAAIPFTGGASAVATGAGLTAMGFSAMGLTVGGGTLIISTAELAILVGGGIAITAILKDRKIKYQADGSVMVE